MQFRGVKDKMYSGYKIWKLKLEVKKFFSTSDAKSLGKPLPLPSEVLELLLNIRSGSTELTDTTGTRGKGKKR